MRSPQPTTVVIACPHCGTRYQLPAEAIGAGGRKVACAHCGESWLAEADAGLALPEPDEDRIFAPGEEEALDRDFVAAERATTGEMPNSVKRLMRDGETPPPEVVRSIAEIRAAITPKTALVAADSPPVPAEPVEATPPATPAARKQLEKRQREVGKKLPAARLLRMVRIAAVVVILALVAGSYFLRTEIVRLLPQMAGVYAALGLPVNVVGLEFSDVSTITSHRGDSTALTISAKIRAVEPRSVAVPPVLVSLVDQDGRTVYQWSVAPRAADVEPGEVVEFSTELVEPPAAATSVRLGFADGRPRAETSVAEATPPQQGTHH